MKRPSLFIALAFGTLIFLGTTEGFAQRQTKKILLAAEDLKWEPSVRLPGVMAARLRGDHSKAAYEEFIKYPAGYKGPLHYHTYDQTIVVIKGELTHNGKRYGPGSYLFIPAGDKHESDGASDSETIVYQKQPGRFDINVVEPVKEKK